MPCPPTACLSLPPPRKGPRRGQAERWARCRSPPQPLQCRPSKALALVRWVSRFWLQTLKEGVSFGKMSAFQSSSADIKRALTLTGPVNLSTPFAVGHPCPPKDTKESPVFYLRQHLIEVSQLTLFKPVLHMSFQSLSFSVTPGSPSATPGDAAGTLIRGGHTTSDRAETAGGGLEQGKGVCRRHRHAAARG